MYLQNTLILNIVSEFSMRRGGWGGGGGKISRLIGKTDSDMLSDSNVGHQYYMLENIVIHV